MSSQVGSAHLGRPPVDGFNSWGWQIKSTGTAASEDTPFSRFRQLSLGAVSVG